MQKGLVDLLKIRQELMIQKDDLEYTLKGKTGYCVVVDNKIVKYYFEPKKIDSKNDLTNYKSSIIVFPISYIVHDNMIIGEIMDYIPDKNISDLSNKTNIKKFLKDYLLVLSEFKKYSNLNMLDICENNITYSSHDGFHIYDSTDFVYEKNSLELNMERFNMALFYAISNYLGIPDCHLNLMNSKFLKNVMNNNLYGKELISLLYAMYDYDYHLIEFFNCFSEMYKQHYNCDIEKFQDMKKYTKILKNS